MEKVLIVTGGSRGIGAAIARQGARAGYKVCVNYRDRAEKAEEVVADIAAGGGEAKAFQADVSSEGDVFRLFAEVDSALGPVTALANNAANNQVGLLLKVISDDLSKTMKIIGRRFAVHSDKGRRATGHRARHKMLDQTILLSLA